MSAVWIRFRAELRARWRAWLGLALLVGLSGGVVLATAAGARRTATAYPRMRAESRAHDALVSVSRTGLEGFYDAVRARPEVLGLAAAVGVEFELLEPKRDGEQMCCLGFAAVDDAWRTTIDRPNLVEGRLADPKAPDEITVNRFFAEQVGAGAGDRIVLRRFEGGPVGEPFAVTIVGVTTDPVEVIPVTNLEAFPIVHLGPRAKQAYAPEGPYAFDGAGVRLRPGTDFGAFKSALESMLREHPEAGEQLFFASEEGRPTVVQRALRPQVLALGAFAALAGVTMLLVLAQALARQAWQEAGDNLTLAAVGMSRWQILATQLLRTLVLSIAGASIAAGIAVAASPLAPIGPARLAEPHPGLHVHVAMLAIGALAIVGLLTASTVLPAWRTTRAPAAGGGAREGTRPSTIASAATRIVRRTSATIGIRLALEPGRGRSAVPVRTTLAGTAIALVAVTAAFTFGASLSRLVSTPRLYGQNWNVMFDTGFGIVPPEFIEQVRTNEDVVAISGGIYATLVVEGEVVPAIGVDAIRGEAFPTLVEGRPPRAPDEIVLGTAVLERIGASLGDRVSVEIPDARELTVVGSAVFPKLGQGSFTPTALGEGAATIRSVFESAEYPPGAYAFLLIRSRGGTTESLSRELERRCVEVGAEGDLCQIQTRQRPADIDNYESVDATPNQLAGILGLLALATLAHALVTSVRRRARDLAILKTIGFVPGQIFGAVAWQASVLAILALLVGMPIGIATGRWAWMAFADQLGVVPEVSMPMLLILVPIVATLGLANIVAAVPAGAAARTQPALVLRTE